MRGLGVGADYSYTGNNVTAGPFEGSRIPLVAAHSGRVHADWKPTLRVNNLLDRRYNDVGAVGYDEAFVLRDAYYPSPERAAWVTATYRMDGR